MDSKVNTKTTFEIKRHIGLISTDSNGHTLEINVISWNNQPEVYDIRFWSPNHTPGKGLSLELFEWRSISEMYYEDGQ